MRFWRMNEELINNITKDILNAIKKLYDSQGDDVSYYDIQEKVFAIKQKYRGDNNANANT